MYNLRNIIEHYTNNGSTVTVCSLDLSKAFDRMNHYAVFIKPMERKLPNKILSMLERWFDNSFICVKWNGHVSHFPLYWLAYARGACFLLLFFADFIENAVDKIKSTGVGCYYSSACVSVILYADDILLLAPSVSSLHTLLAA